MINSSGSVNRTLLVIDDDSDVREVIVASLSTVGFIIVEACCGEEGLMKFYEHKPHLVVLDIKMPGLSGIEVCKRLRCDDRMTPILLLTALDGVEDKVEGLSVGADDYLTKPFHYQELLARVRALLRVRDLTEELEIRNKELISLQAKLLEKERRLVAGELAGTAAHTLGQPLSSVLLYCDILGGLCPDNEEIKRVIDALKADAERMALILDRLKKIDPTDKEPYHGETEVFGLGESKRI